MQKVHLIMPMGGAGTRFAKSVGFNVPKPLIPLYGHPFFYWATKAVTSHIPVNGISFIVLREHVERFHIDKEILAEFPDAQIAVLHEQVNGPVLTCLSGLNQIFIPDNCMVLFNDCDHIFHSVDLREYLVSGKNTNGLVTFKSSQPQFSYIQYDEHHKMVGTVEKRVVSDDAICGAYLFRDAETFRKTAEKYVREGTGNYSEFFMSGLYNILCRENQDIRVFETNYHVSFGTPDEYQTANYAHIRPYFSLIGDVK